MAVGLWSILLQPGWALACNLTSLHLQWQAPWSAHRHRTLSLWKGKLHATEQGSQATLSPTPYLTAAAWDPFILFLFPRLLFHYTAKMNGRLWGQMKTQLCGLRRGDVTDKCGRNLFHGLVVFWLVFRVVALFFPLLFFSFQLHTHTYFHADCAWACPLACLSGRASCTESGNEMVADFFVLWLASMPYFPRYELQLLCIISSHAYSWFVLIRKEICTNKFCRNVDNPWCLILMGGIILALCGKKQERGK